MRKLLLITLAGCTFTLAGDLYTDTYFSQSGLVKPRYDTGIPNPVSANTLMQKRTIAHTSLYFKSGILTQESVGKLQSILDTAKGHHSSYVAVIGHTSGYTLSSETVYLNRWSTFWQNIGSSSVSIDDIAASVNQRILAVYDQLKAGGFNPEKIYTENRMDRDPISTEATKRGSATNRRVDVVVYR